MDPTLLPTDDDLLFEEELLRTPYNLTLWVRYLDARKDAPSKKRHLLYERAVRNLPGSYKLWHAYLRERLEPARGLPAGRPEVESLNNAFERALVTMHKMPRIWELYLRFLTDQRRLTRTRRAFDRALAALPVTQHDRVWVLYLVRAAVSGRQPYTTRPLTRRWPCCAGLCSPGRRARRNVPQVRSRRAARRAWTGG
jgi:pre-mRNA-splicing factor SYF1